MADPPYDGDFFYREVLSIWLRKECFHLSKSYTKKYTISSLKEPWNLGLAKPN
jgi:hypothetical protein